MQNPDNLRGRISVNKHSDYLRWTRHIPYFNLLPPGPLQALRGAEAASRKRSQDRGSDRGLRAIQEDEDDGAGSDRAKHLPDQVEVKRQ